MSPMISHIKTLTDVTQRSRSGKHERERKKKEQEKSRENVSVMKKSVELDSQRMLSRRKFIPKRQSGILFLLLRLLLQRRALNQHLFHLRK